MAYRCQAEMFKAETDGSIIGEPGEEALERGTRRHRDPTPKKGDNLAESVRVCGRRVQRLRLFAQPSGRKRRCHPSQIAKKCLQRFLCGSSLPWNQVEAVMVERRQISRIKPDAMALRALAHPQRMRMLAMLRIDGPATATALAERMGLNSGATSYHLRQLA